MLGIWHGGDWLKEIFGQPNLWSSGTWNSMTWLSFSCVNKSYFPVVFHEYLYLLLCVFDGCYITIINLVICWL